MSNGEQFLDYLSIIEDAAKQVYGDDIIIDIRLGRIIGDEPRFNIRLLGKRTRIERAFAKVELQYTAIGAKEFLRSSIEKMAKALIAAES